MRSIPLRKITSWKNHMNRKLNHASVDKPMMLLCVKSAAEGTSVITSTWTAFEAK